VKNLPQEESRLQVPRIFLHETICCMQKAVNVHPTDFVFNLNEVGIFEWGDRKSKKIVLPLALTGQTLHYGIARNLKRITIIT
jgi:hypothetical protein